MYRLLKNWLENLFSPAKNKWLYIFSTKYVTHALIVIIALLVVFNNLGIREIRAEEFGQNSLIASLLQNQEQDITETMGNVTAPASQTQSSALAGALNPKEEQINTEDVGNEIITTEAPDAILKPNIAATAGAKQRIKVEYYTVEGGDTVSSIAEKFNLGVNTILWENKLGPRDFIKPGDKLTILPVDGISHQIKKGETLEKIASTYQANIDTILEYNLLADANSIEENQIIIVPGGQMPAPEPTRTTTATPQYALLQIPPSSRVQSSARLLWPTVSKRINQYFKWRHTGIDIDGNYSSPIYAAESGRIERSDSTASGYGLHIVINHGGGVETLYGHLSKTFVRVGDSVQRGQTIGMMGCTGWCTGPHVHFEVIIGGRRVNPLSYL